MADHLAIDTIVPATDLTMMLLASQPDSCKFARLATPRADSYETLTDKSRLLELAGRLAIPAPITRMANITAAEMERTIPANSTASRLRKRASCRSTPLFYPTISLLYNASARPCRAYCFRATFAGGIGGGGLDTNPPVEIVMLSNHTSNGSGSVCAQPPNST